MAMLAIVMASATLSGCYFYDSTDVTTAPVAGTWAVSGDLQRRLDARIEKRRTRKLALQRALRREARLTAQIRAKASAAAKLVADDVSCQWRSTTVFVSLTLRNDSRSTVDAFVVPGYVTNTGVREGAGIVERVTLAPGGVQALDIDAGRPGHVDPSMSITQCTARLRDVWLVPVRA